jgi:hypothetical protein
MVFLTEISAGEWVIVFATLMGPILAVRAQKIVEAIREKRNLKTWVFTQMMATRQARLSPEHVRALNMIDIAFYGRRVFGLRLRSNAEQAVCTAWKEYFDALGPKEALETEEMLLARRDVAFYALLAALAKEVGYDFDLVQLKRGAYSPMAHGETEQEQNRVRKSVLDVLEGRRPLPMEVVRFPVNDDAVSAHQKMVAQLVAASDGGKINVQLSGQKS